MIRAQPGKDTGVRFQVPSHPLPAALILLSLLLSGIAAASEEQPPDYRDFSDPCDFLAAWKSFAREHPSPKARDILATAYNNCGSAQVREKKITTGLGNLQEAKKLAPKDPAVLKNLAYAFAVRGDQSLEKNEPKKAKSDYEQALRYDPGNPDIKLRLSDMLYRLEGRTARSSRLLNESVQDTSGKWKSEAASRRNEARLEGEMLEEKFDNWVIRIQKGAEGIPAPKVYAYLKEIADSVAGDLDYRVKHPQVIVLIDDKNFDKIHSGPGWAGAINDGRIKVPFTGAFRSEKLFKSVLAHEYTHSVVRDLTYPHPVPFWLNEGLAEYEEARILGKKPAAAGSYPLLRKAYRDLKLIPMQALCGPDAASSLPVESVPLAYEQAKSFVAFVEQTYRFYALTGVLSEIKKGATGAEATRKGIGRKMDFLEEEWKAWLGKNLFR